MKVLVVFSAIVSLALCELGLGGYNYEYSTGNINRSEMRHPNGSVTGQYNFADENGFTHDIEYSAGANQGFKIISHRVTENGNTFYIDTDYTPEVQSAQNSHLAFQNYLRMVLPQISEEELPPVYIRHVPSPVKKEPEVPIIAVLPPMGASQRQVKNVQGVRTVRAQSQQVLVVNDLPPSAQLGGRTLFYDRSPSHIKVNIEEVPFTYGDILASQQNWQRVIDNTPAQQVVQRVFDNTPAQQVVQPVQQTVQPAQHQFVHQPQQIVHQPQQIVHQPAQHQFVHQPQQIVHQPPQIVHQPAQQSTQEVGQFVQQRQPIAQDIQLVNGFTPEVARATQEHLSHVAAIKAVLPHIE